MKTLKYILFAFLLFSVNAQAAAPNVTLPALTAPSGQSGDSADGAQYSGLWALKIIFGNVVDNPLAAITGGSIGGGQNAAAGGGGGDSSLLGSVFLVFNLTLLSVAILFVTYSLVTATAATAHEGDLLGKKQSTIWTPIRIVLGLGGIAPVIGGWSLAQCVAILFAVAGVRAGDFAWVSALDFIGSNQAMSQRMAAGMEVDKSLAQKVFAIELCRESYKRGKDNYLNSIADSTLKAKQVEILNNFADGGANGKAYTYSDGGINPAGDYTGSASSTVVFHYFGRINNQQDGEIDKTCGESTNASGNIKNTASNSPAYANFANLSKIQKNSNEANQRVATQLAAATNKEFATMQTSMASLAVRVLDYTAEPAANATVKPVPAPNVTSEITAATKAYNDAVNKSAITLISASPADITAAIVNDAKKVAESQGFLTAGAYFSMMARASAPAGAFSEIKPSVNAIPLPPSSDSLAIINEPYVKALEFLSVNKSANYTKEEKYFDAFGEALGSGLGCQNGVLAGSTGRSFSLGQCIVTKIIPDTMKEQHPIIALKEAGDWIVLFTSVGLPAVSVGKEMLYKATGTGKSSEQNASMEGAVIATIADALKAGTTGVGGGAVAVAASYALWAVYNSLDLLESCLKILLPFGLMLSVYLPMIPLIHWLGAIISWLGKVIEATVSASLLAFAHLDTDGEGLGQRTQHGYVFIFDILLTPILMVIGLILSLLVMKVVGSIFFYLYPLAMADIQANSWTGIFSIVSFLVIFCTTSVMLITNACDLIHFIPDKALTWIGGQNGSALGKKVADNFAGATGALGAILNNSGMLGKPGGDRAKTLAAISRNKNKKQSAPTGGGGGTPPADNSGNNTGK